MQDSVIVQRRRPNQSLPGQRDRSATPPSRRPASPAPAAARSFSRFRPDRRRHRPASASSASAATPPTSRSQTNGQISNFFIGGETNNVILLGPRRRPQHLFGKGMDNVTILTHYRDPPGQPGRRGLERHLDRDIEPVMIGGDVVNTTILAGYAAGPRHGLPDPAAPTDAPAPRPAARCQRPDRRRRRRLDLRRLGRAVQGSSTPRRPGLPARPHRAKVEGTINNSIAGARPRPIRRSSPSSQARPRAGHPAGRARVAVPHPTAAPRAPNRPSDTSCRSTAPSRDRRARDPTHRGRSTRASTSRPPAPLDWPRRRPPGGAPGPGDRRSQGQA